MDNQILPYSYKWSLKNHLASTLVFLNHRDRYLNLTIIRGSVIVVNMPCSRQSTISSCNHTNLVPTVAYYIHHNE